MTCWSGTVSVASVRSDSEGGDHAQQRKAGSAEQPAPPIVSAEVGGLFG